MTDLNSFLINSVTALEWTASVLDKMKKQDHTAFEVYANNIVIPVGEHPVLGTVTNAIDPSMTETFGIRTYVPVAANDVIVDWGDGIIQTVKNGEHGGVTGPDSDGEYTIRMTHTYAVQDRYIVRIYGRDYFNISHAPSVVDDASNIQCRVLDYDLPVAKHVSNLSSFCYNTQKLTKVRVPRYDILNHIINHSQMFSYDKNLLSVTGFKDCALISRGAIRCFNSCENMVTCDFNGVLCTNNSRAMNFMYKDCRKWKCDITNFFPTRFSGRSLDMRSTFENCLAMTGTVPADKFWGDKSIIWTNTDKCFAGCSEEIRSQVPTTWGGTAVIGTDPDTGTNVKYLQFVRPVEKQNLHLKVDIYSDSAMQTLVKTIDSRTEDGRRAMIYHNGTVFVEFPESGEPEDGQGRFTAVDVGDLESNSILYIMITWESETKDFSVSTATIYPAFTPSDMFSIGNYWRTIE